MKRTLSLTIEADIYRKVKEETPERKISSLVNKLLKENLRKIKLERTIAGYKSVAQSKAMREEDKIWEGSIEDGIEDE